MLSNFFKFIVIVIFGSFTSCFPDHITTNIFKVVNLSDKPIYVEITANPAGNETKMFNKEFLLYPNVWRGHFQNKPSRYYSQEKFFKKYPILKFVIKEYDEENEQPTDSILEIIELNSVQFFHIHRSLYYPMPARDKAIIEQYK